MSAIGRVYFFDFSVLYARGAFSFSDDERATTDHYLLCAGRLNPCNRSLHWLALSGTPGQRRIALSRDQKVGHRAFVGRTSYVLPWQVWEFDEAVALEAVNKDISVVRPGVERCRVTDRELLAFLVRCARAVVR